VVIPSESVGGMGVKGVNFAEEKRSGGFIWF